MVIELLGGDTLRISNDKHKDNNDSLSLGASTVGGRYVLTTSSRGSDTGIFLDDDEMEALIRHYLMLRERGTDA